MSIKNRTEMKKLNSMKLQYEGELEALKNQKSILEREICNKGKSICEINQKINSLKSKNEIIVSEHAMLRYIERVLGINLEELREKILPEIVEIQCKEFGNGKYTVNNQEFTVVLQDNVVVSVLK